MATGSRLSTGDSSSEMECSGRLFCHISKWQLTFLESSVYFCVCLHVLSVLWIRGTVFLELTYTPFKKPLTTATGAGASPAGTAARVSAADNTAVMPHDRVRGHIHTPYYAVTANCLPWSISYIIPRLLALHEIHFGSTCCKHNCTMMPFCSSAVTCCLI